MATQDQCVSIHPYFKVPEKNLAAFHNLCERFVAATTKEPRCLYYGFSFADGQVHCREAYEDAAALLTHLDNVNALIQEALTISELARLEIHGTESQLAQLREPLKALNPTFFTLEYGIRR